MSTLHYLSFTSEAAAKAAMPDYLDQAGNWINQGHPDYIGLWANGVVQVPTGNMLTGADGNQYPETTPGEFQMMMLTDTATPKSPAGQYRYFPTIKLATLGGHVDSRVIKDWQFRDRFTPTQLVGIMRAAMSGDDTAALVWLKLSTASDGVDLSSQENINGVMYVAQSYPALAIDPNVVLA